MLLTDILKENAKKFSNAPALTMRMGFRTTSLTYKQVYDLARQIALFLEKHGVQKGDKVLLLAPNSPYWIAVFWGCLLKGVIVVPLNVQSMPDMIDNIAKQTEPKIFFAHRFCKHDVPGIARYNVEVIAHEVKEFDPQNLVASELDEEDLIEILYTSGTTGEPKGAMLSHKNLYTNIHAVAHMAVLEEQKERILSILPLSHIFEQAAGFLLPYVYGEHIIYAHSPSAIGSLLKKYKITKMAAVPEFLKIMMSRIEAAAAEKGFSNIFNRWFSRFLFWLIRRRLGGKLDTIVCGGAPLDPELEKKWNSIGIILLQGYGLTETAPLVTGNTYTDHRVGSVGKVAPGVQMRIADDGEVQVKGENVFRGYYKNEVLTRESFTDDGWFKTGDVGELDKDGYLFLKGRKKYLILGPGGQNVFPEDLEEVLNGIDCVRDSCVLGLAQPSGMMQIHATLLLDRPEDEIDVHDIIDKANEKLASYQQIGDWFVWPEDDFPRSATRKVRKEEVLKVLQTEQQGVSSAPRKCSPLVSLLSMVTGIESDKIATETKLVAQLHLDSLMRIELIAHIEDRFGILINEPDITNKTTVGDLEKMLQEKKPVKGLPPLKRWPRWWWVKGIRFLGQHLLFLIMRLFVKIRVEGKENIENLQLPVVFMPNHASYLDPFVLVKVLPARVRRTLAFAAANDVLYAEFKYLAPLAELLFNAFPFPRKENENIKLGLDYMGQLIDDGHSMVVYPEGKISVDGTLQPLKKGAGLIGVEMGAPVIPVVITGANEILPYAKMFPRKRGTVTISFGKPISFSIRDSVLDVGERIEKEMQKLGEQG